MLKREEKAHVRSSFASFYESFVGFCQGYFSWIGRPLLRIFKSIKDDLEAANIRIYPEAYTSVVGFFLLLSFIISLSGVPLILIKMYSPKTLMFVEALPYQTFILLFSLPVITLIVGIMIPKFLLYNRASNLDAEVPYAAAYISAMSTGGISPYVSIQRLKKVDLLPQLSKSAERISVDVQIMGMDPVTAIERSAKALPSAEYRDLLLGYASTLRTGGDVVHFLLR
ncbi:hypothetical protein DRN86_03980, partial [Candidatus Geothermarchaeota archaeon]